MNRIVLFLLGVLVLTTNALAQAPSNAIDKALLAAPENLRDGAMVVRWKPDFTYETLRKGANGLVCYDRSGQPEHQPFMIECTSIGNLKRAAQNIKFEAVGDKVKTQALLDAAEKNGTRAKPEYGSVWYHFMGPDREHARAHMTIALPGATTKSTGLPETRKMDGVWLMDAGTSTAHLMTPGE
jgi:hypothetical protein